MVQCACLGRPWDKYLKDLTPMPWSTWSDPKYSAPERPSCYCCYLSSLPLTSRRLLRRRRRHCRHHPGVTGKAWVAAAACHCPPPAHSRTSSSCRLICDLPRSGSNSAASPASCRWSPPPPPPPPSSSPASRGASPRSLSSLPSAAYTTPLLWVGVTNWTCQCDSGHHVRKRTSSREPRAASLATTGSDDAVVFPLPAAPPRHRRWWWSPMVAAAAADIVLVSGREELLPIQSKLPAFPAPSSRWSAAAAVVAEVTRVEAMASLTSNRCDVGFPSFRKIISWMSPFAGPWPLTAPAALAAACCWLNAHSWFLLRVQTRHRLGFRHDLAASPPPSLLLLADRSIGLVLYFALVNYLKLSQFLKSNFCMGACCRRWKRL